MLQRLTRRRSDILVAMKQRLLDLHIYFSLVSVPYLVIYGLSTLSMVHDWEWMTPRTDTVEWEQVIDVSVGASNEATAESIRDALGLFGFIPAWELRRPSENELRLRISRPGRQYQVRWMQDTGRVNVSETRPGFWGAIRGLHGLRGLPRWPLSAAWTLYTELSIVALVLAVAGGLYFWWLRLPSRRVGAILLAGGSGGAFLFMIYIVW